MPGPADDDPVPEPPDLRVVLLALAAWTGALSAFLLPGWVNGCVVLTVTAAIFVRWRGGSTMVVLGACVAAAAAAGGSALLRVEANQNSPVAALAAEEAFVEVTFSVRSDPLLRQGEYGPYVLVRGRVLEVTGRGRTTSTRVPLLVIADPSWRRVELGSRVRAAGRLSPPEGVELAAVLSARRPPTVQRPPPDLFDAAAAVRAGIRDSVAGLPIAQRSLVPALVVGDDQGMPPDVVEDFQVAGLTHLLAVSGTNLTLVVGFVLILARWAGIRGRGLVLLGVLGVLGFVLLARTEPSVLRAAAMGSVALVGMGTGGRRKGARALGVAVLVLLLFDPWLALSPGFVLSSLATAGILFLAPPWRDALMRWLPRWAAEVVSVPLAAQLACTPVVAAISGQVSLVAVAANMLAAPAVGPATVLGLAGGLVSLVAEPAGRLVGHAAGWCAWWIVAVAEHGASLPSAAVDWATTAGSVTALTVLCLLLAMVIPRVLGSRWTAAGAAVVLVVLVVAPARPTPGWPPAGWVMAVCDVGQGDALVLNAGAGAAVVVDTGPDPELVSRCLARLDVDTVPVVVLTHFHADHVDGLPGVLADFPVEEVTVTGLPEPAEGAAAVEAWAAAAGVPTRVPVYGEQRTVGEVSWQHIGPPRPEGYAGEEGDAANNASLVLLVEASGVRILLSGDLEPEAQRAMGRALPGLRADVLKVPHHGSRYQHPAFLTGLGARLAVVSAGEDNDYGHPSPVILSALREAGLVVRRTDRDGDIVVIEANDDSDDLRVETRQ